MPYGQQSYTSVKPMAVTHVATHVTLVKMKTPLLQASSKYSQRDYELRGRYQHTNESGSTRPDSSAQAASNTSTGHPTDPEKHGSYKGLILHPKWKQRRKEILDRDSHSCVNCRGTKELQVHHRQYHFVLALKQYKAPWDYPDRLLITLCVKCHGQGHSKFKVPIIKM